MVIDALVSAYYKKNLKIIVEIISSNYISSRIFFN